MKQTWRHCSEHGMYQGDRCPECPVPAKEPRSTKYGGVRIVIPPHMKASK